MRLGAAEFRGSGGGEGAESEAWPFKLLVVVVEGEVVVAVLEDMMEFVSEGEGTIATGAIMWFADLKLCRSLYVTPSKMTRTPSETLK